MTGIPRNFIVGKKRKTKTKRKWLFNAQIVVLPQIGTSSATDLRKLDEVLDEVPSHFRRVSEVIVQSGIIASWSRLCYRLTAGRPFSYVNLWQHNSRSFEVVWLFRECTKYNLLVRQIKIYWNQTIPSVVCMFHFCAREDAWKCTL